MGGTPSKESKTFYSYFRGTYEIGLIPLTKAFFGLPNEKTGDADRTVNNNNGVGAGDCDVSDASLFGKSSSTASERWSTLELRRQFVQMRNDPVILYLCSRTKTLSSWKELFLSSFTEEDLDCYLDKVEEMLYETDVDMITDTNSPLLPVPCALCLVCKEGQGRSGSFMWHGRSIVVVGFFGVMTDELRKAFKIKNCSPVLNLKNDISNQLKNDVDNKNNNTPELSLYMNACILASAGDRTLERVLVLAPVMLRNQYLDSFCRVYSSLEKIFFIEDEEEDLSERWNSEKLCGGTKNWSEIFNSSKQKTTNNEKFFQIKERALSLFKKRLSSFTVHVEAHVDNYSFLKCLSENVAFLQSQIDLDPTLCTMELPKFIFDKLGMADNDDVDVYSNKSSEEILTNVETAQESSSGVTEERDSVRKDTKTSLSYTHDEVTEEFEVQQTSCGEDAKQDTDTLVDLIRICFFPKYVVEAAMWASNLLMVPNKLFGGRWIQYKLKDESEKLRQKLHGKDFIVSAWRTECKNIASTYLGENTLLLLRHVKALQKEVDKARGLPLTSWAEEKLIQTREGRTCALHHTSFGTMLVGIRGRGDNAEVSRGKEKKKNARAERSLSLTNDHTAGPQNTDTLNTNARVNESVSASSFPAQNGVYFGSAPGGMASKNNLQNVTAGPGAVGDVKKNQSNVMFNACGGCISPQYGFVPQIQLSRNPQIQANMAQSTVMYPYFQQTPGNTTLFTDQMEQPGAAVTPQQVFYCFPFMTPQLGTGAKPNNVGIGDLKPVKGDFSPQQDSSFMPAPQYPFPLCGVPVVGPNGTSFSPAGNIPPQQQPQQQQQMMFLHQTPGAQPVFMSPVLTPQQSSVPPLYGYQLADTAAGPQVVLAPQQPLGQDAGGRQVQMVVGSHATPSAPAEGPVPNFVYYVTAPTQRC